MLSAEFLDEADPQLPVVLELLELGGIDDVAEMAGDHEGGPVEGVEWVTQS